jgi:hypothetical protein
MTATIIPLPAGAVTAAAYEVETLSDPAPMIEP